MDYYMRHRIRVTWTEEDTIGTARNKNMDGRIACFQERGFRAGSQGFLKFILLSVNEDNSPHLRLPFHTIMGQTTGGYNSCYRQLSGESLC